MGKAEQIFPEQGFEIQINRNLSISLTICCQCKKRFWIISGLDGQV
jgi:hypothetical protein